MKDNCSMYLKKLTIRLLYSALFFATLLPGLIAGCSSGGSTAQESALRTGSIAVNLTWVNSSKTAAKLVASAPADVATVRIIISAPDITLPQQNDFSATGGVGTLDGIPAGNGRRLTAQGIDAHGNLTYQGCVENLTVTAGQTTNAGTVYMSSITYADFSGTIVLGSPTTDSIMANVFSSGHTGSVVIRHGTSPGEYDGETSSVALTAGNPLGIAVTGLSADTGYYYRLYFLSSDGTVSARSQEYTFHTARPAGSAFTFTIQADSHLDENSNPDIYRRTLANILADAPDFHIDLGDTFMCEKHSAPLTATVLAAPDQATVDARYEFERGYFGLVSHSVPLFLVNGNHEGELGWLIDETPLNLAVWTTLARRNYYMNPVPGSFYSGDPTDEPYVGKRASWYAWNWGDALFIVLDPYWNSKTQASRDPWAMTLGEAQYNWLRETLAASQAKFKFVFIHNLVGGLDGQMRGGIEAAPYFEWGGKNTDGTDGFTLKRPGWDKPVHQLLVQYGVAAVFHGHDHLYARQNLDGIVYQEVPQPSSLNYLSGSTLATAYHYASGTILSSSGHIRVTVGPDGVTARYVRAWLPSYENARRTNGQVDDTWSIGSP